MLKNLINEVLQNEGMSINQLSQKLGVTYANTHSLVNREDLTDTKIGTLVDVARILRVNINELYELEGIKTMFDQDKIRIMCNENGGYFGYSYNYFKEDFEDWARDLDITLADTDHLRDYVRECGYNVKEII